MPRSISTCSRRAEALKKNRTPIDITFLIFYFYTTKRYRIPKNDLSESAAIQEHSDEIAAQPKWL